VSAPACPDCGGVLDIITGGQIYEGFFPALHIIGAPLPMRQRPAPFAACRGCEFCLEIDTRSARILRFPSTVRVMAVAS
jgi:hypothetical protein